jgi:hypothetical protein
MKFNLCFGEHIASIFRVEEYFEQETSVKAGGKQCYFVRINKKQNTIESKLYINFILHAMVYIAPSKEPAAQNAP